MYWPRWYFLSKKRVFSGMLVIAVILSLVWSMFVLFDGFFASEKELFDEALSRTVGSSSFRYSVEVKQGGGGVLTIVQGERVAPDRVHIKGALQKSQMEFIQIGDTVYMKDPWSDRWFTIKNNSVTQYELFIFEFNPLTVFNFKDVLKLKKTGKEKVDGYKTVVMEIFPITASPLLEMKYSDTKLKIWVDPGEKIIRRVTLYTYTAGGVENLEVNMKFWDFNERINISAPQEKSIELE